MSETICMGEEEVMHRVGCGRREVRAVMLAAGGFLPFNQKSGLIILTRENFEAFLSGGLRQFCVTREEFEAEQKVVASLRESRVYLLQCNGSGGPVKIGWAALPERRLIELRIANPYPLEFIGMLRGEKGLEIALHGRFKQSRIRGEWFEPTRELLELAW